MGDVANYTCKNLTWILEQELDGKAIAVGLASSPGPDWLKDVVPTLGLRLKVHNAVRTMYSEWQVSSAGSFLPS